MENGFPTDQMSVR